VTIFVIGTGGASSRPSHQETAPSQPRRDVSLTVYNANLGLVKDVRELRLPEGQGDVRFTDVATQIDPTSVHLESSAQVPRPS
jgi:hypothetical protein